MENKNKLAFSKKNYILMLIGIGILILGFTIMTLDTEPYGFGFLGITLGPTIVIIGFIFQFFAILHKSRNN
jgi:hypothetical protein